MELIEKVSEKVVECLRDRVVEFDGKYLKAAEEELKFVKRIFEKKLKIITDDGLKSILEKDDIGIVGINDFENVDFLKDEKSYAETNSIKRIVKFTFGYGEHESVEFSVCVDFE